MLIIHVATGLGGGTGTVILELAKEQNKSGNIVAIVTPYDRKEEFRVTQLGLIYCPSNSKKIFPGSYLLFGIDCKNALNKLQREYKQQAIVHYHNFASLGILSYPSLASVCTIHSSIITSNFDKIIYKFILRKKTTFVSVSSDISLFLSSLYSKASVECVLNGIEKVEFTPKSIEEGCAFRLCYTGALTEAKGWRYVLETFINLYQKNKDVLLVIAGKGYNGEEEELKKRIYGEPFSKNIMVLGEVENAGINVIPNCNVLVLPSISEGTPMTLLESLRAGVPILATNVGGVPSILKDGENGFFIKREARSIENAVLKMMNDKDLYHFLSSNCIETFNSNFSSEKMMLEYEIIYNKIIACRGGQNE